MRTMPRNTPLALVTMRNGFGLSHFPAWEGIIYYRDSMKCGFPTNIEREKIYSTLVIDCCIENNENVYWSRLAKASTIIEYWSV